MLVPAAGSGIPGAPADWEPQPGMEQHIPVLFLDLNGMYVLCVIFGKFHAGNSHVRAYYGALFRFEWYERVICELWVKFPTVLNGMYE